jgi:hypothetical protein
MKMLFFSVLETEIYTVQWTEEYLGRFVAQAHTKAPQNGTGH